MRHLIVIGIIMLLVSCGTIQHISLTDTVVRDGTKSELWVKANMWMIDIFINAESVVQFSDKDAGVIKGRYAIKHYDWTGNTYWSYAIITIITVDNNATIEIDGQPCLAMYQPVYDAAVQGLIIKFNDTFY